MDNSGFGAPAPQEAAPVAPMKPEKKGGKGALIGMIIFMLIAIGLGVWLAIILLNPQKCNDVSSGDSGNSGSTSNNGGSGDNGGGNSNGGGTTIVNNGKNDEEVRDLVSELLNSIDEYSFRMIYSDGEPIKASDKLWTVTGLSFGGQITARNQSDAVKKQKTIVDVLKNGHSMTATSIAAYGEPSTDYYKNSSGLLCYAGTPHDDTFEVLCTNENWLKKEDKDLAIALANTYNNTEEGKKHNVTFVSAFARKIKKSKSGSYESIAATFEDSVGYFYRKTGGDWKYFTGTQQELSCSEFKTSELKEAFEGTVCWDGSTRSTVKR